MSFHVYTQKERLNDLKEINKYSITNVKKLYDLRESNSAKHLFTEYSDLERVGFNEELPFNKIPRSSLLVNFVWTARVLYRIYLLTKESKYFNEYLGKLRDLSEIEVIGDYNTKTKDYTKFFNFNLNFEEGKYFYFIFYIVAKWLKFKPSKEFEALFDKCLVALEDTKWW